MSGNHLVVRPYRRSCLCQFSTKLTGMRGSGRVIMEYFQACNEPFDVRQITLRS